MKKILVLLLLILAITFALDKNLTRIQTTKTEDKANGSNITAYASSVRNIPASDNLQLGRVECVGGTCYDWVNGPCATWCVNDAGNGIYVSWLWSNTSAMTDRNMRYNFYDWSTRSWNWIDNVNYMNSGINVFPHTLTSVAGGADLDRATGNFVIASNYAPAGTIGPKIGRDQSPGAGLFEYTQGPIGWRWPFIAVSQNQTIHVACIDAASTDSLYYTKCQPWGTWSTPMRVCAPAPDPMFPNQNIATSKVSNKVCIVWECSDDPGQERAFYRISNDNGASWQASTQLPFPPSVGMTPSFGVSSLFAMYDAQDNLHIVFSVSDTGVTIPAEIWHWCPANTPALSLIHHYEADTLTGPVGYNAIFACRPTLIQEPTTNYFYVAWEQFDSLNYEPLTGRARADIHIAQSNNNGQTWNAKARITSPNTTSKRFPVVGGVEVTPSTTDKDTLLILYMVDSIAGAFLQNEHRFCTNPMMLHRVPVPLPAAIEEEIGNWKLEIGNLSVYPNPANALTTIRYSLPAETNVLLNLYDISGKLIRTLVNEYQNAGSYSLEIGNWKLEIPTGIYFYSLKTNDNAITKKIIITN